MSPYSLYTQSSSFNACDRTSTHRHMHGAKNACDWSHGWVRYLIFVFSLPRIVFFNKILEVLFLEARQHRLPNPYWNIAWRQQHHKRSALHTRHNSDFSKHKSYLQYFEVEILKIECIAYIFCFIEKPSFRRVCIC